MKHMTRNAILLLTLTILLLAALGCSNLGFQDGAITVDVTLNASTLNNLVGKVGVDNGNIVGKIEKIELIEPNIMRITAEYKLGEKTESGSIDFAITTGGDGVKVEAVNSTLPGLEKDSPAVQRFNTALGNALGAFAAEKDERAAGITDIKVKDGSLVFTLSVKVK
jgi:hypothetical protein